MCLVFFTKSYVFFATCALRCIFIAYQWKFAECERMRGAFVQKNVPRTMFFVQRVSSIILTGPISPAGMSSDLLSKKLSYPR